MPDDIYTKAAKEIIRAAPAEPPRAKAFGDRITDILRRLFPHAEAADALKTLSDAEASLKQALAELRDARQVATARELSAQPALDDLGAEIRGWGSTCKCGHLQSTHGLGSGHPCLMPGCMCCNFKL